MGTKLQPAKSEGDYYFNDKYLPIAKDQLKIGSILHYYGKAAPNTRWEVCSIWWTHPNSLREYAHNNVHKMSDRIRLYCLFTNETKIRSFRHISKSPLWRLQC